MKKNQLIYQFRIQLLGIQPSIWRKVQVPASYSFWDLHVALQDAMGWLDYHLHVFRVRQLDKRVIEIGVPMGGYEAMDTLSGWDTALADYFREPGDVALYEYDFGDGWEHELLLDGIFLKEKGVKYPRCIGGERACPPEDCGSIYGYYHLLEVLADRANEEYNDMVQWLKGHAKNYYPYDSEKFDALKVKFSNPKTRLQKAFPQKPTNA
jgi:hypothetical protein